MKFKKTMKRLVENFEKYGKFGAITLFIFLIFFIQPKIKQFFYEGVMVVEKEVEKSTMYTKVETKEKEEPIFTQAFETMQAKGGVEMENKLIATGKLTEVARGGTGFKLEGDPDYFSIYSGSVIKRILSEIEIGTMIEVEYFEHKGEKITFKNVISIKRVEGDEK